MNEEIITVGFDAISDRLEALYPGQEEKHYGTILKYAFGGKDPLDGIGVWKSDKGEPHWHYVTYGFSELYEKETEDLETSGYGFELTFRLERSENEEEPPVWPMNLLQNIARYVFSTGNVFASGHHMSCNGPIMLGADTLLTALGFVTDPELLEMDTPNGHVEFLQAVAITQEEMNGLMCWNGEKFIKTLEKYVPYGITKLERKCLMSNETFVKEWKNGVEQDGSSTGFLYMNEVCAELLDIDNVRAGVKLKLGAGHVNTFLNMLSARVGKGRKLYIQSTNQAIQFDYDEKSGLGMEEDDFAIILFNKAALKEIREILVPKAGVYPMKYAPVIIELVKTEIKDSEGNIVEVIG